MGSDPLCDCRSKVWGASEGVIHRYPYRRQDTRRVYALFYAHRPRIFSALIARAGVCYKR